ncbi:hypothetical protein POREN0001_0253 [Porphyromonas endodontalis ATCC 35406]|uniref:Uncharacterized protein n=1 Tax=Porphyromonas endodontalis (strain ATCC 35406 / DSM 24491 / JCM 8526 / CCUG 16442 / BCRC 14492 / NCTC 13058 / HG 370) TaxID=553175 RepID=C3JAL6_POREA|nr:hypothetical protein POREN0001_0253 [Porphyromonas endodontalis ATCC 35406]
MDLLSGRILRFPPLFAPLPRTSERGDAERGVFFCLTPILPIF